MTNHYHRVNLYLPEELYQTLVTHQEQQKLESASDAVVEILSQFFKENNPVKNYATEEQLKVLEKKVTHLNQQVTQLYQILANSAPHEAAKIISSESNDYALAEDSFEEEEDEPDEILYDFLEPGSPHP
jgi:hypothetical protein